MTAFSSDIFVFNVVAGEVAVWKPFDTISGSFPFNLIKVRAFNKVFSSIRWIHCKENVPLLVEFNKY
jgi:hypothetical protein